MRFILVAHRWFVSSQGFSFRQIEVESRGAADMQAAVWERALRRDFTNVAVEVVSIGQDERIVQPRRLSWRERLSGWISPEVQP